MWNFITCLLLCFSDCSNLLVFWYLRYFCFVFLQSVITWKWIILVKKFFEWDLKIYLILVPFVLTTAWLLIKWVTYSNTYKTTSNAIAISTWKHKINTHLKLVCRCCIKYNKLYSKYVSFAVTHWRFTFRTYGCSCSTSSTPTSAPGLGCCSCS